VVCHHNNLRCRLSARALRATAGSIPRWGVDRNTFLQWIAPLRRQPFRRPTPSRQLLSSDPFDGHYRVHYTVTLFAEICKCFVNVHKAVFGAGTIRLRLKAELTSVALSPICSRSAAARGDILAELLLKKPCRVGPLCNETIRIASTFRQ